jgi:vacuolar-type H+-ATPase subunit I/STV1
MMHFKTADLRISFWFTVPIGFATGMLAATIAVGGFIGVPGMIYILGASSLVGSASELVIAFIMGLAGTVNWAMHGMVDIRLTLIILAGSLLGVQLGAIGTTYVKEHMIKVVMGTIMLIVAVSRALACPKYLSELGIMSVSAGTIDMLTKVSFGSMCLGLLIGAVIILGSMFSKSTRAKEKGKAVSSAVHYTNV